MNGLYRGQVNLGHGNSEIGLISNLSHSSSQLLLRLALIAVLSALPLGARVALADSMTVSPTSMTVLAPDSSVQLTVRGGKRELTLGQVRVMKVDFRGKDEILSPTKTVIASPPAMRLRPNQEVSIRLIRQSTSPVRGRECYRVLVDQIPQKTQGQTTVGFIIRQSIPLCFVDGR